MLVVDSLPTRITTTSPPGYFVPKTRRQSLNGCTMSTDNPWNQLKRGREGPDESPWGDYAGALIGLRSPGCTELSDDNISALAPHLAWDDVEHIRNQGQLRRTYFIGPPLRVHGAVQVFCIDSARADDGVYGVPFIYHALVGRRPESFINHPDIKKTARKLQYPYMEEAEDFACQHWPDEMVWDDCTSVLEGRLINPGPDYVKVAEFTAWSQGDFPDMLYGNYEPVCEIVDDSLLEVSLWEPSRMELTVGHKPYLANFCALCGGGIDDGSCSFCDAKFNMPATSPSWPYALPRTIEMAYKRVNYDFKIEPIEARKAEHRKWAEPGFVPEIPIEFLSLGKQQRSIEL
jgi:hypothetical protein